MCLNTSETSVPIHSLAHPCGWANNRVSTVPLSLSENKAELIKSINPVVVASNLSFTGCGLMQIRQKTTSSKSHVNDIPNQSPFVKAIKLCWTFISFVCATAFVAWFGFILSCGLLISIADGLSDLDQYNRRKKKGD